MEPHHGSMLRIMLGIKRFLITIISYFLLNNYISILLIIVYALIVLNKFFGINTMNDIRLGSFIVYPTINSFEISVCCKRILQGISSKIYHLSESIYLDYKGIYKY